MALQKNIKLVDNFGIEVEIPNVYIKVEQVDCTKKTIIFHKKLKKNSESNEFLSQSGICNYDINGENPIKQAYLHLKTLPEFSDAIDC